jgi:two-component system response regulator RegA
MTTAQLARMRALVVEDHKDDAYVFALLLKRKGWNVAVCDDAAQALAIANEFRPSIIFMDIHLKGANGIEIAQSIRRENLPRFLLVARTGLADAITTQRCMDAGFDSFFAKPGDSEQLDQLLNSAREIPI